MIVSGSQLSQAKIDLSVHGAGLLITFAIAGIIGLVVLRPIEREQSALELESSSLEGILDEEALITAQGQELSAALEETNRRMQRAFERIPTVPREADFLGQITQSAQEVGLEIVDYRPGVVQIRPDYREMTIQLASEGTYPSICGFLAQLDQLPRLSRVTQLTITPRAAGEVCDVNMKLAIFFSKDSQFNEEPTL